MAFSVALLSFVRRYGVALCLLALAIFWQIVLLPSAYPPSHYETLGLKRFCSVEEVNEAYANLAAKWDSGTDLPKLEHFVKVRYAFELLSNPIWKRDYDVFSIDEQSSVIEKVIQQNSGKSFTMVELPILNSTASAPVDQVSEYLTAKDFVASLGREGSWLIQVCSFGSSRCAEFSRNWKLIVGLLEGVARTGTVELGEIELAAYLASRRKLTGQPFFEHGLPSLVAFPHDCRSLDCLSRYEGDFSADSVVNWMATDVLGLPRIFYYNKDSLVNDFFRKSGSYQVFTLIILGLDAARMASLEIVMLCNLVSSKHDKIGKDLISEGYCLPINKVKVVFFSKNGERAAPFLREAAKAYWSYASFAFVLWREEESSVWWNMFEVDSAPAVALVRDPGVKPLVFHGQVNSSWFSSTMEQHKNQVLPQIRKINSIELGCDARGYSRAGNDTTTWYCVILAGRLSMELNNMRKTMRRIQEMLTDGSHVDISDKEQIISPILFKTVMEKRLTFGWIDGEAQSKYCLFYLSSEHSYETCGPKKYGIEEDVPRLFIVRYHRNSTNDDAEVEKHQKSMWNAFNTDEFGLASQLVAKYNGSTNIPEILGWIAKIIMDGDSNDLPYYKSRSPELVPEDVEPIWSKGTQGIVSGGKKLKRRIWGIFTTLFKFLTEPMMGSLLLLGACISFGVMGLHTTRSSQKNQKVDNRVDGNMTSTATTEQPNPPTLNTEIQPDGAHQWVTTDSESE